MTHWIQEGSVRKNTPD